MAATASIRVLRWTGIVVGVTLLAAWMIAHWMNQARLERERMLQTVEAFKTEDRKALAGQWGEKLSWYPNADAPLALAVTPRNEYLEFDAFFVLYRGDRAVASLVVTQVAGYYNGQRIDARRHPDTLLERPLNAGERADLSDLIQLLDARVATLDPQSERHGWNRNVLKIARKILGAQRSIAPPPTS